MSQTVVVDFFFLGGQGEHVVGHKGPTDNRRRTVVQRNYHRGAVVR